MTAGGRAMPGTERSFGLSVGGVLCAIAAVLAWRNRAGRAEVLAGIGVLLVVLGLVAPGLLRVPRIWWWRGARLIGDFNARLLLTLMFAVIVTPIGLLWRVAGKDPLARKRSTNAGWLPYPPRYRDRHHYGRMY